VFQVKIAGPFSRPAIILVFQPVEQRPCVSRDKLEVMAGFGALVAVPLQARFLGPPAAIAAASLRNVVPAWSLSTISQGMGNFMAIQVPCLISPMAWPERVLWLPRLPC